jgi:hypothetical protein
MSKELNLRDAVHFLKGHPMRTITDRERTIWRWNPSRGYERHISSGRNSGWLKARITKDYEPFKAMGEK